MLPHPCCICFAQRNRSSSTPIYIPKSRLAKAQQIAAIDAEVLQTENAIVALVKRRASLKRKRNAFSPAVNLPPELLSLIFEFACLPRHADDDLPLDVSNSIYVPGSANLGVTIGPGAVTPFFLGSVCMSWRNISRGTSQLWKSVIVALSSRHANAQAILLRRWLAHAGSRPLSIKVIEDDANDDEETDEWGIDTTSPAVIHVLAEHAPRWHTVDIFLPAAWKTALTRVAKNLPLLTRLTLRTAESSPSLARVTVFAGAPALREVTLVGYGVANVDLPWVQLTQLEAECFSAFEAYETLRRCSAMRRCLLEQRYRGVVPFTPHPFTHSMLETLELVVDSAVGLGALLGALTLPSLRRFVLALPEDCEEPMLKWVTPLLRRSACRLERLHLVGETPKEHELVECLRLVPTLRTLLLLNPKAETGGKLTEYFLDSMNAAEENREEGGTHVSYALDRVRWQERTGDWEAHFDGNADASMDPAAESGQEREQMEGPLVPNLESLIYQGPVAFNPHALVEFLLTKWYGSPSLPPSAPTSPSETLSPCLRSMSIADNCDTPEYRNSYFDGDGGDYAARSKRILQTTARLRSVIFTTPTRIRFEGADAQIVRKLQRNGMHLQFLSDPHSDL
ncbi:hypothetical protein HYPSUDRAFT_1024968 [Hypholoma sublateritium FD-334 SS-4]|uniref:F-box domain-containing protein n=1 Tax=Hypholoma sublateritium (strain FD-334 SS-4) TaxID=945553 RepID=A0A0D2KRT8_HYPSF|nr:hypothetical protein HYPSUDRAFT_1024968 [Hypholoma sublateritium FD-334 SS-4]